MKYKVGDKVRVRNDLVVGKEYGGMTFVPQMSKLNGKTVTIEKICKSNHIVVAEQPVVFLWSEEMFEPADEHAQREIRIIVDGRTVTATEGKYKGIARCSPEDEFNTVEGVRLAVERLEKSKKWPQIGDDCFKVTFCGSPGKFEAFSENVTSIDLPAVGKLIFRTKEEAQAQADRLNKVLEDPWITRK